MQQKLVDVNEVELSEPLRENTPAPESAPEEEREEEAVESKLYHDLDFDLFKTPHRLIDDLKADLLFIIDKENPGTYKEGILKKFPIKYSKQLEGIAHNPYDLYTNTQDLPYAPTVERRHSKHNPKDKITIIRSMLFNTSEASLSRSKVFHVRILIKVKEVTQSLTTPLTQYHLVEDLLPEDAKDLIEEEAIKDLLVVDDIVEKSLPKLIDSANYVCSITNKILRIEISEPEFNHEELHDFEIGPINVRYNKALTAYQGLDERIPSPAQCLSTLFKAIRGPLKLSPTDEHKCIEAGNKVLNSKINPEILVKNLNFKVIKNEFDPPNFSDHATNLQSLIIRESYIRKIHEISLLGIKSYSAGQDNPFYEQVQFAKDANIIFHELGETAPNRHHESLKLAPFINLSVYPFYSDEIIMFCYEMYVMIDGEHLPTYFDSIKAVSSFKATYALSSYVAKLTRSGLFGQTEIDNAYKTLHINPEEGALVSDDILLTMYKEESAAHPLDIQLRKSLSIIASLRDSLYLTRFLKYEPLDIKKAYDLLEIDSQMDDDIVITALMIKLSDESDKAGLLNRAFITIAIDRNSFKLLNKMENDFPDIYPPSSYLEGLEFFGLDETADEMQMITAFQSGQFEVTKARNALRSIANLYNNKVLLSFLETGLIDHSLLPAFKWPVGLNNIGNTCYLNSLLQYYFSIKPFRDVILSFQDVYNGEEIYQNRRIGGRLVGDEEIERSFQFTYHLRDLFYDQIHSDLRCITPKKELAYLAFLPSVTPVEFEFEYEDQDPIKKEDIKTATISNNPFHDSNSLITLDEDFKATTEKSEDVDLIEIDSDHNNDDVIVISADEDSDAEDSSNINNNDDYMVLETSPTKRVEELNITDKDSPKVEPKLKPKEAKVVKIRETEMETAYEIGRQQDVTECIGNVLSQVEATFKPESFDELDSEQDDLVKKLFFGKTVQHLNDVNNPNVKRDKIDRFMNLFVNISDKPRNIYEAFDLVFKTEELEIDGGVFNRSERITSLPVILQIQIQRVYFDRVALRPYKSIEPLSFPENLYMDRYFDTDNENILTKRKQVDDWKLEITTLKERRQKILSKDAKGSSFKDSLKTTKEWLESNDLAKPETLRVLNDQIIKIDNELIEIYNKIESLENKIDHQFDDFTEHGYSIFAIFIHRGEANYGHYWIYIKDSKNDLYRKYNDEIVSEVPKSEVFNFDEGNTATPYFLGYVKNGHEDEIEPLCRVLNES